MFSPVIINYKYNNYVYVLTVAGMCLLSCMHLNRNHFWSKEVVLQESGETKGLKIFPSIMLLCPWNLRRREGKDINTLRFRLSITSTPLRNIVIIFACTLDLVVGYFWFSCPLLNYKRRTSQNHLSFQIENTKEKKKDKTRMHNAGHSWIPFKEFLCTNGYGEKRLIINDTV